MAKKPKKILEPARDPRKKPSQSRAKETVDAILTAAKQWIETAGYDSMTTTAVAERAGVSIGSFYQYFPNRISLVAALVEEQGRKEADVVKAVIDAHPGKPLKEVTEAVVRAYWGFITSHPKLYAFVTDAEISMGRQLEIRKLEMTGVAMIREILERSGEIAPGRDACKMAFLITYSTVNALRFCNLSEPEYLKSEDFADELVRLIVNYL